MRVTVIAWLFLIVSVGNGSATERDTLSANWKVEVVVELHKARAMDSTVELRNPSREKGLDQVQTFVEKLETDVSKKIPAVFYANPPWAGTLVVKAVMRQKVTAKLPSVETDYRATDVAHTLLSGRHFPDASTSTKQEENAKGLSFKAKDYEFAGVNIKLIDFAGKDVMSFWYGANSQGKMKTKECVKDLVRAMKLVASRSDFPRGNWERPQESDID